MLLDWEKGDETVKNLWSEMNSWVYAGFAETYKRLGVDFDQVQYESNTYLLGKDLIQEGLVKGILYKKEDGSVWCDLSEEGLDHKLLLRGDGTSVYMPAGKMKSREGTVVDADDLMQEMHETAKEKAQELGKLEPLSEEDKEKSYETVGLGALKYFMLKVDPKKTILI